MPVRLLSAISKHIGNDFWKFWTGQTISTLGSSFTSFALPLLIYNLTGSSLNLALTVVATVLPYLFFGLVIGAWVDRVNRKQLMILTDLARALVIASIPLAALAGFLSVWWIYAGQRTIASWLLNRKSRRPLARRATYHCASSANVDAH
jgi:MFS family permease